MGEAKREAPAQAELRPTEPVAVRRSEGAKHTLRDGSLEGHFSQALHICLAS